MNVEIIDLIIFVLMSVLHTVWIYAILHTLIIGNDEITKRGILVLLFFSIGIAIFFTYIGWGEVTPVDQPPRCWGSGVCD